MKVKSRTISLPTYDGKTTTALVTEPEAPGPWPAVAFGAEAMGPNEFSRETAERAAALGLVTITPDYYRGGAPSRPDDYTDFTEVIEKIGALDFRYASFDVLAGVDWLRAQPNVDGARVAVWGYCTGGTLAMMAACLDRRLAASVLFFPSQPMFEELNARRPAHPMDMLWSNASPMQIHYGDQDPIMPPELLADLRARLDRWGVEHEVCIYPGANHAFSAPAPHMHDAAATAASWEATVRFLTPKLGLQAAG